MSVKRPIKKGTVKSSKKTAAITRVFLIDDVGNILVDDEGNKLTARV